MTTLSQKLYSFTFDIHNRLNHNHIDVMVVQFSAKERESGEGVKYLFNEIGQ